ncbi:hypothetical protein CC2G_011496 [Coprinopsis cinerea AmutBmut pab1-1]|nr:hypothetical protein CC2G_011496 [Coprinopsis cinerea AmutBmut pab1-1]
MFSVHRTLARIPALALFERPTFPSSRPYSSRPWLKGYSLRGFDSSKVDTKILARQVDTLLHFKAKEKQLLIRPDGYMRVHDVMNHCRWPNRDFQQFKELVEQGGPERFYFTLEPEVHAALERQKLWWIRKTAQKLKKNKDDAITRILDPVYLRHAIYKAPSSEWDHLRTNGIRPVTRKGLIVLSPRQTIEEKTDRNPVNTSFIYINLDVEKAMRAGVDFYKSRAGNVLSPGNRQGVITPDLFKDVVEVNIDQEELLT